MSEFREHESVTLARDIPTEGLVAGEVGTIVGVWRDEGPFEVEYLRPDGTTRLLTRESGK